EARHEHDARQRVELAEAAGKPRRVAPEIGPVLVGVAADRDADLLAERGGIAVRRTIDPERERLRADQVVGGEWRRQRARAGARQVITPWRIHTIPRRPGLASYAAATARASWKPGRT